jgi:hypothetical protein
MGKKTTKDVLSRRLLGKRVIITKGGGCRAGWVRQVTDGNVAGKYEDGTTFFVNAKHVELA